MYTLPTQASLPSHMAKAADGGLWFSDTNTGKVGRIDVQGNIEEFALPDPQSGPAYLTPGPDGAMWFTEVTGKIGRITADGHLTEYTLAKLRSLPEGITVGPDGAIWFADETGNYIGRITTSGALSGFPLPDRGAVQCGWVCPHGIVTGPDGALWFTEEQFSFAGGNRVGRMTTAGKLTEYLVPTADSSPWDITVGLDGNVWFGEATYGYVGRITMSGSITEFALPNASQGAVALGMDKGPFNSVWFPVARSGSGMAGSELGRIAPDGTIRIYSIPGSANVTGGIAIADDGAVWFTYGMQQIWRFVPMQ